MALQPYPTKQEFLASDLEPMEHPECSICKVAMTEPVRLPCQGRHEFCRVCITEWLKRPRIKTCPMCRQTLCRPKHNYPDPPEPMSIELLFRHETVMYGFVQSGLGRFLDPQSDFPNNTDPAWMETFHDAFRFSEEHLQRLSVPARAMLVNPLQTQAKGALLIDAEALGSSLVLMGNVMMRSQRYDDDRERWSQASLDTWAKMLLTIWQLLSPHDGIRVDSRAMFHAIMASLLDQTVYGGDAKCCFFTHHLHLGDLTYLVYFLLTYAGTWISKATVQTKFGEHRIIEPRALPRTASSVALRHADRLTKQAFGPVK